MSLSPSKLTIVIEQDSSGHTAVGIQGEGCSCPVCRANLVAFALKSLSHHTTASDFYPDAPLDQVRYLSEVLTALATTPPDPQVSKTVASLCPPCPNCNTFMYRAGDFWKCSNCGAETLDVSKNG